MGSGGACAIIYRHGGRPNAVEIEKTAVDAVPPHFMRPHHILRHSIPHLGL